MFQYFAQYVWSQLRSCLGLGAGSPASSGSSETTSPPPSTVGLPTDACPSFIPITAFEGGNLPQAWPPREGVGHSVFNGQIVFTNLDRALVKTLLPDGLQLAQNTACVNSHPIIHLVGEQTNTGWSWSDGEEHYFNEPYQEFILLVPFVLQEGSQQWHNYVVRMYLNSAIAQILGDEFAYRKMIGQILFNPANPRTYRVMTEGGFLAFSTEADTWDVLGSDTEAEAGLAVYGDMKKIMQMPVLGVDPDSGQQFCSRFEWTFTEVSSVVAITTRHSCKPHFDPPLLAGLALQSTIDGAVFIRGLKWTLAMPPSPCGPGS